jgi:hypothetical protein
VGDSFVIVTLDKPIRLDRTGMEVDEMIEFTETEVFNWRGAIRGARNSWESHDKSDSKWVVHKDKRLYGFNYPDYEIGPNDHALLFKLANAGSSHAKWTRQVMVCVDINAPLYWWKEMDQYKFIVTNSESTMHTIQRNEIVPSTEMFSLDIPRDVDLRDVVPSFQTLEMLRNRFLETKDRRYWKLLIQLLPSGWMQKRTTTLNYATIRGAYHDRKGHRLSEWQEFREWAESLPYSEFITGVKK